MVNRKTDHQLGGRGKKNKPALFLVPSSLPIRHFRKNKGVIEQAPQEAVFYSRKIEYPDKFYIDLSVIIFLIHDLGNGDVGRDEFWATLIAEDLQCQNTKDRRPKSITLRPFENIHNLIAWLRSPDLEKAVRAGIVVHPPAPIPSPKRFLARALFRFSDDIEQLADHLADDLETRQNMCTWRKRNKSSQ